mmetsp:Transcript_4068/g.10400  ORF Transcript_4068/g.10400 Transcript_4068/m.10400 type:complete len:358 (+) Transcript_4068:1-1074(+)
MQGDRPPYLLDAVHLSIVFSYYGAFQLGTDIGGANSNSAGNRMGALECSELVHNYGQSYTNSDPATAFEYYCLAAEVKGGGHASVIETQGQLLRELLNQSRAFGTLLGAGGSGSGALLSKLKPDKKERQSIIVAAAVGCMQNAQFDEAIELFMHADKPMNALDVINKRYCDVISLKGGEMQGQTADDLEQRGNAAIAAMDNRANAETPTRSASDLAAKKEEIFAFQTLCLTRKLFDLFRESRHGECFQLLAEFTFLPIRTEQVSKYASDASNLHIAVKEKLPQVVKIAGATISELMQERRAIQVQQQHMVTPSSHGHDGSSSHELRTRLHSLALYAGYVKIIPENIATELNILLNTV